MPLVSLANGKPQRTLLKAMPVPAGPFDMRFLGHAILGYAVPGHAIPWTRGSWDMRFLDMRFLASSKLDPMMSLTRAASTLTNGCRTGTPSNRSNRSNRSNMSNMSDSAATTLRLESP